MASDALEPDTPDRLNPTVIARNVLMLDILVHIVGQLEKLSLIFERDALVA